MNDFTIIIPHFNCARKLKRMLDSIGKHENMQIIVVDDNSDDDNTRILKKLEKELSYVEFYKNSSLKRGAGICRNIGLDHANGKWLLFADADDYFTKNYYNVISNYINCNVDMIMFPYKEVSEKTGQEIEFNSTVKYIDRFIKDKDIQSELALRYKMANAWSRMILTKKITENDVRFDETIVANDVCFSMKISYYCKKLIVDENIIYCYTKSPKTLTTTISTERYDIRMQVFVRYYNFLKNKLSNEEFKLLQLNGSGALLNVALDGLGIKYVIKLYFIMKKNGIKVFDIRMLNIPVVIKKVLLVYKTHREARKTYMDNEG